MAGIFNIFKKKDGNDLEAVLTPEKKKRENFLSQFLPDDPDKQRAMARSLMMGGAAMMAGGGPSAKPTNLLQIIGQGIGTGVGAYDESLTTDNELMKTRDAARINNVKLQTLQDAQTRSNAFTDKYGQPSENGYSTDALFALHQMQLANGDEESARATQKMIQELQQTAAGNGMVLGEGGYKLAPGYGESLRVTKANESLGSAVGQNAQLTSEMKDFLAGQENPAFRAYETAQKKAGVAQTDKFGGKSDELAAERFAGYQQEGLVARDTVANMQRLTDLSRNIGTGKMAEVTKTFGPYAEALGIKVDGLSDIQLFDSMVAKIAPTMRVPGSGATSDFDAKQFLAALPSLSNTTEGNALIGQTTAAIERNKVAAGEIANKVFNEELTWQEAEKQIQALPDPYSTFRKFSSETKSEGNGKSGRVGGGAVVVNTEEEFNALPPGSSYRFADEDVVRQKL